MAPKVTLINWTPKPHETLYWAFMNMHNPIPNSLDSIEIEKEELEEFMKMMLIQPHQTVFEFINFTWFIEGASRAFQQQLTRTRQASYSIQSLRIVAVGNFKQERKFLIPGKIKRNTVLYFTYLKAMENAEQSYRDLIEAGATTEDARNVLPLSIQSPITMSIDFRSLIHMLGLRLCENTQGEFREIAQQMKAEIEHKVSPLLASALKPLCFSTQKCVSPVPCEKYDFPKAIKMDVSRWIKG